MHQCCFLITGRAAGGEHVGGRMAALDGAAGRGAGDASSKSKDARLGDAIAGMDLIAWRCAAAMAIAWRLASSTAVISVHVPGAGEFSSLISVPAVCGALPMMSFFPCGVMGAGVVFVAWLSPHRFCM